MIQKNILRSILGLFVCGTLFLPEASAQQMRNVMPDSGTIEDLHNYVDPFLAEGGDSVIKLDDTTHYQIEFQVSGGFSSWRGHRSMNIVQIFKFQDDSTDSCSLVHFQLPGTPVSELTIPNIGEFRWNSSPFLLRLDQRHDQDSNRIAKKMLSIFTHGATSLERASVRSKMKNYHVQFDAQCAKSESQFPHRYMDLSPTISSYRNGELLILSWPVILQHGGETDHGFQNTWFLRRMWD